MKELTKAEEQVMHPLWQMGNATVKQIIDHLPEPTPAYNTVSTLVRILEKKGFVDHVAEGKGHIYFPIISKQEYTRKFMNALSVIILKIHSKILSPFLQRMTRWI